jgi:DNA-binding NtrC family response regulator
MNEHLKPEFDPAEAAQGAPPAAVPTPAGEAVVKREASRPGFRILIVEDDEWDAERAQRLLNNGGLGFTAAVVATRSSFEERLASFRPDVILSDFSLPGFSGEDALRIAQQRCPWVPVIIWSGVLGDEAAVSLIKQGATDYILKDRPARLASAVSRALAEARSRAQLAELEGQLTLAQRLASLGQFAAAEQAVKQTRELLAAARGHVTVNEGAGQA